MDHIEVIRKSELFSALLPAQWDAVRGEATVILLDPGDTLFTEHEMANRFFFVTRGLIKLTLLSQKKQEKVLRIVSPGQTFGEVTMFLKEERYPFNAIAIRSSSVYSFNISLFINIVRESEETTFRLLGLLSQRIQNLLQEVNGVTLLPASCRFVRYILKQIPDHEMHDYKITLNIPKAVLSAHISVQPPTLSRIMRWMSDGGLIQVNGPVIHVINVETLRSLPDTFSPPY